MALGQNKTALMTTGRLEQIKQYFEYDGSLHMSTVYEAATDAAHGNPCLKTEYEYDGATTRITKMKESESTWDSSWDI